MLHVFACTEVEEVRMLQRVRGHASYANAIATIAVFVAIGGTSFAAITLPRNSVGEKQIKSRAVGSKELKRGAVRSRIIKNGAINLQDLSKATRDSLSGSAGPPGPPGPPAIALRASIGSSGGFVAGNPSASETVAPNKRLIRFARDLAGCVPTATLARNAGPNTDPGPGRIVVAIEGNRVAVETFTADGSPAFLPFNLIVAC
jgi:hypothetical protein